MDGAMVIPIRFSGNPYRVDVQRVGASSVRGRRILESLRSFLSLLA
jgi:hypothetical protein